MTLTGHAQCDVTEGCSPARGKGLPSRTRLWRPPSPLDGPWLCGAGIVRRSASESLNLSTPFSVGSTDRVRLFLMLKPDLNMSPFRMLLLPDLSIVSTSTGTILRFPFQFVLPLGDPTPAGLPNPLPPPVSLCVLPCMPHRPMGSLVSWGQAGEAKTLATIKLPAQALQREGQRQSDRAAPES